jgi:hypothetical protein
MNTQRFRVGLRVDITRRAQVEVEAINELEAVSFALRDAMKAPLLNPPADGPVKWKEDSARYPVAEFACIPQRDEPEDTPALTFSQRVQLLLAYGWTVAARDAEYKPEHSGAFMVVEDVTDSESWGIVGDDLHALVDEASNFILGMFDNALSVSADILAGGTGMPKAQRMLSEAVARYWSKRR